MNDEPLGVDLAFDDDFDPTLDVDGDVDVDSSVECARTSLVGEEGM
jgi:hypothetical protein